MADELVELVNYRRTLHQIYETCRPDELVQGWVTQDMIELVASGEHKRGELLMSGENGFIPATSAGLGSAEEICILAATRDIPEGQKAAVYAYFSGTFKASSVILPYETEEDDHEEQIELVRETLRQHKIFVK